MNFNSKLRSAAIFNRVMTSMPATPVRIMIQGCAVLLALVAVSIAFVIAFMVAVEQDLPKKRLCFGEYEPVKIPKVSKPDDHPRPAFYFVTDAVPNIS